MATLTTHAISERRIALVGVFLCIFLGALDQTIVSTALPRIVQDLGGTSLYAWVATSYLLASTVALPIAGRLADIVAPKYILLVAATLFLIGSALSGLSHSMDQLILFRGIQGLGGGAIFAVASTVIGLMFPPRERGRVQGLFGAVFGLASVVGPYLGGLLTDSFSWRYVFYVNMPFGAIALYVLLVHMPLLRTPKKQRFDGLGALTLVFWTVPLLLALSWGGTTYKWLSWEIIGLIAFALAVLVTFYQIERRSRAPLFHMDLLKIPTFTWAGLGTMFFGAAFLGSVLFLPFYLVMAKNISPLHAGLVMTPLTGGVVVGSMLSGLLASRIGRFKILLVIGNVWTVIVFAAIYFTLKTSMPMSHLVVLMFLLGVGIGPGFPLYTLAVQNVVRLDQMGVASSGNQFFRQIGSSIGAAVMGVILVTTLTAQIPAHLPKDLRGRSGAVAVNSDSLSDQTQTRRQIEGQFRHIADEVAAALRGSHAAYATLIRDPRLPASYKKQLVPGGIPAAVHHSTQATLSLLTGALAGNTADRAAILQNPNLPASLKAVAAHPPASPAARAATLQAVQSSLTRAEPGVIQKALSTAVPDARRAILQAGQKAANEVVRALSVSISNAVKRVFGMGGLLALMAFLLGLVIPNLELRRHSQGHPTAAAPPDRGPLLRLALLGVIMAREGARHRLRKS
ncbi:MAG: MDR family MFS transporter [Clostridia bacterium]